MTLIITHTITLFVGFVAGCLLYRNNVKRLTNLEAKTKDAVETLKK